jgi:hypothetical protein
VREAAVLPECLDGDRELRDGGDAVVGRRAVDDDDVDALHPCQRGDARPQLSGAVVGDDDDVHVRHWHGPRR